MAKGRLWSKAGIPLWESPCGAPFTLEECVVIAHKHVSMQWTMKTLGEFSGVIEDETTVVLGKEASLPLLPRSI